MHRDHIHVAQGFSLGLLGGLGSIKGVQVIVRGLERGPVGKNFRLVFGKFFRLCPFGGQLIGHHPGLGGGLVFGTL
ncbi:MAG: hypothetical protein FD149_481 [Rhodospirillaceae bacterium]|nr:MAG: hypothetical protein FD149_481 [Rhodospirillaceae bacterium]